MNPKLSQQHTSPDAEQNLIGQGQVQIVQSEDCSYWFIMVTSISETPHKKPMKDYHD